LGFRFKRPKFLRYLEHAEAPDSVIGGILTWLSFGLLGVGAVVPTDVDNTTLANLGYLIPNTGVRNSRPTDKEGLKKLFKTGVIVDVAHMSQQAQIDTLQIAQAANYPVMNSHT